MTVSDLQPYMAFASWDHCLNFNSCNDNDYLTWGSLKDYSVLYLSWLSKEHKNFFLGSEIRKGEMGGDGAAAMFIQWTLLNCVSAGKRGLWFGQSGLWQSAGFTTASHWKNSLMIGKTGGWSCLPWEKPDRKVSESPASTLPWEDKLLSKAGLNGMAEEMKTQIKGFFEHSPSCPGRPCNGMYALSVSAVKTNQIIWTFPCKFWHALSPHWRQETLPDGTCMLST